MQNNFLSGSFEMFVVTFYSLQQHIKESSIAICILYTHYDIKEIRGSMVKSDFLVGWVLFRFSTKFSLYCSPCLSHVFYLVNFRKEKSE
jgi:hypothetical protein